MPQFPETSRIPVVVKHNRELLATDRLVECA